MLLPVVLLCSRQLQVDVLQLYLKRDCHRDMAQLWVSDSMYGNHLQSRTLQNICTDVPQHGSIFPVATGRRLLDNQHQAASLALQVGASFFSDSAGIGTDRAIEWGKPIADPVAHAEVGHDPGPSSRAQ